MPPADRNDLLRELLAACARRDRDAFTRLYETTSAKLFGVAVRILRREDLAEEVLQDCYVNIWNHAATYSPGLAAPMTWMSSIVRNRCLDRLRRPNPEIALDIDEDGASLLDLIPSDDPGPLERLAQSTEARAIAHCLDTLEQKQRTAITLAFFEGLTHAELAAHLKQPLGTVKTWVRRGLLQLKTCLGPA